MLAVFGGLSLMNERTNAERQRYCSSAIDMLLILRHARTLSVVFCCLIQHAGLIYLHYSGLHFWCAPERE